MQKIKIRKGDKVKVLTGRDRGREGEVARVFPSEGKIIVGGINMLKRFTKKTQKEPGGIVEVEAPLSVSKVAFLCSKCKKASRLGKGRICKNCGAKV
ncbi:50S ribosomal protein L24 [candidate division WWE3 bacterium RIFCSPHIGHO2_01_FULL_48_15]|uniref:Large ribosomal subunit protein uL24 n=1 Tax=candidate division WWE3 bacterium RIFCSPHIGHO2_01_FULL_48_15 TaxID=1802619 RepID=A0A1F4V9V9_UNCKA|nr:MAG: 50S ribosomal protein L24 [candidate division WWE3 bacterium RIFCSPHIGHO2_01_FULL_48_15]